MKIDEIRVLLERYQQGLCTEEEKKAIEEWQELLSLGEEEPLSEQELQQSLSRIRLNLQDLPGSDTADRSGTRSIPTIGPGRNKGLGLRRRSVIMAAAAVVFLAIMGTWLLFSSRERNVVKLSDLGRDDDTTIVTSRGESRQIVLADGSTIQLNAATELKYPKRFRGRERSVTLLRGEAFFQVATHPDMPFTVTAGHSKTTVLGTSFDIRAYGQEKDLRIALLTGKVKIERANEQTAITLLPKQFLRIDKTTGALTTGRFEKDYEVAAWKDGGMHFEDASFADIAFEIGNKYNVEMINKSDKHAWSYTGLFRNSSLEEVIQTICQTEDLSYQFTADGILITNKN